METCFVSAIRRALVVGGTGPSGPHIVKGLIGRGFRGTLFHRGTHESDEMPEWVEHIHGDPHFSETIQSALGQRDLDLVVAIYGRTRLLARHFKNRVERFIAIGSVAATRGHMASGEVAGADARDADDDPVDAPARLAKMLRCWPTPRSGSRLTSQRALAWFPTAERVVLAVISLEAMASATTFFSRRSLGYIRPYGRDILEGSSHHQSRLGRAALGGGNSYINDKPTGAIVGQHPSARQACRYRRQSWIDVEADPVDFAKKASKKHSSLHAITGTRIGLVMCRSAVGSVDGRQPESSPSIPTRYCSVRNWYWCPRRWLIHSSLRQITINRSRKRDGTMRFCGLTASLDGPGACGAAYLLARIGGDILAVVHGVGQATAMTVASHSVFVSPDMRY